MRIKSFFADSVQEAIDKARTEIGPDAMLMTSKETAAGLRALGTVEVVFGLPDEFTSSTPHGHTLESDFPSINLQTHNTHAEGLTPAKSLDIAKELAELRHQIERIKHSVNQPKCNDSFGVQKPEISLDTIQSRLASRGLSEELAQEICDSLKLTTGQKSSNWPGASDSEPPFLQTHQLALSAELERRLLVDDVGLGRNGDSTKTILFVGPPGSGKTTALIKLSLRVALKERLPVHLISVEDHRIGSWTQLAAYARISGLGFDTTRNVNALDQLIAPHLNKKLVLIDTPGFGTASSDFRSLSRWIATSNNLDVHLVLPSTLRTSVISRVLDRFRELQPKKLILTRSDEINNLGELLDIAIRSKLFLSYISTGQNIPEDIQQACKIDLLAYLNPDQSSEAARYVA